MARPPFRFGILSTALIGREHVIPAIQRAANCTVTGIASRSRAKAWALAGRFGVPHAFGSYDELLASPEIDGVYVPLPTSQHVEWTLAAARAAADGATDEERGAPFPLEDSARNQRVIDAIHEAGRSARWERI